MEQIKLLDLLVELMIESPENVLPTQFGLDNPSINNKILKKLKLDTRLKRLGDYKGGIVYKVGNKIFSEYENKIVYFLQFEEEKYDIFNGKSATQIKVWKGQPYRVTSGIPSFIFWEVLFDKEDISAILSDKAQTSQGQIFWQDRISDAIDRGYYVYIVNFNDNTHEQITSHDGWDSFKEKYYGDGDKYKNMRFAICKNNSVIK